MVVRTAVVAGASGLVGGCLLRQLLADLDYGRVVSLGRRTLDVRHPKLEQQVVDFLALERLEHFPRADDVFCCLGTTLRKAGSQEAFRQVDHDAVVALARAARAAGATRFLHVSSLGAHPRSRFFYNRVKGETERDVAALGFPAAISFRPSLLDGARQEVRVAERLGLTVARGLAPLLGRYGPTPAEAVAAAMVREAKETRAGAWVASDASSRRGADSTGASSAMLLVPELAPSSLKRRACTRTRDSSEPTNAL
jgi:uncharacterized protein YbjT (DUF2867 family)